MILGMGTLFGGAGCVRGLLLVVGLPTGGGGGVGVGTWGAVGIGVDGCGFGGM